MGSTLFIMFLLWLFLPREIFRGAPWLITGTTACYMLAFYGTSWYGQLGVMSSFIIYAIWTRNDSKFHEYLAYIIMPIIAVFGEFLMLWIH